MKGKKKAAATLKMGLSEGMEDDDNMVEVPVQGGNVEAKERRELDYYNEDDREAEEDDDYNEEEAEDEEKEKGDEEGEMEARGQGEERARLDEGFFEIEAIRRKRVRKGQLQYLIKWRGWPETSNTWEPVENLQSCYDVIEAFEESLLSGKSSRKRKRKHGGPHIMPKKKQQISSTSDDITGVEISVDKTLSAPVNGGEKNEIRTAKKADENGHTNGPRQYFDKKEDNEYDPKLSELKGMVSTNDVNEDKLAVDFQEGVGNTSGGDGLVDGVPKLDNVDPLQSKSCTGSKRRKSGSVKRFKKDTGVDEQNCLQNSPLNASDGLAGETLPLGVERNTLSRDNLNFKPIPENSSVITKIIKPIGFSSSVMDNTQDVLVSFVALRSDGKEVVVDNKFLKSSNPHLLIDFYEQHLKYSA